MAKNLVVIVLFACLIFLIPSSSMASSAKILGPEIRIQDNNIIVSTALTNIKEIEKNIKFGIEKEIVFTIELFRVWSFWPDTFVTSKKIRRIIKYDNLRERYLTSFYDGTLQNEKSFRDFDIMKNRVFKVNNVNIANIKELESGNYYIRVVVESKSRELPPVIGFLMLFIPEVEMSLARESQAFKIVNDYRGNNG